MSDDVMSRSAAKRIEAQSPGEMADRVRKAEARGDKWSILAQELDEEWGQAVDWAVAMNARRLGAESERDTAIRERGDALAVAATFEKQLRRLGPERDAAEAKLSACEALVERWRADWQRQAGSVTAGVLRTCGDELAAVLREGVE